MISPFALAGDLFASFDIANGDLRPKRRHRVEPGSSAPVENHGALRVIRDQAIPDVTVFTSAAGRTSARGKSGGNLQNNHARLKELFKNVMSATATHQGEGLGRKDHLDVYYLCVFPGYGAAHHFRRQHE